MKALITGIHGQDAYYLSAHLNAKGYEVVGTRRGNEEPDQAPQHVRVVYGDVADALGILDLIEKEKPDEIYNLAAITHVGDSFSAQAVAAAVNFNGAANVMAAAARVGAKVYQAGTSELFGDSPPPQSELTAMRPRSPYAVAKLAAHWMASNYRDRGHYVTSSILFNHESPRRGGGFVSQKVCRAVADIVRKRRTYVSLGNLDAKRDWGHAADYVRAMHLIMQQPKPDDYVVATGEMRSVRELCKTAFGYAGLDYEDHVTIDPTLYRPLEVEQLCGDASKIKALGWKPEISFDQMIAEMVDAACSR